MMVPCLLSSSGATVALGPLLGGTEAVLFSTVPSGTVAMYQVRSAPTDSGASGGPRRLVDPLAERILGDRPPLACLGHTMR